MGRKRLCARTHITSAESNSLSAAEGSRARLRALEALYRVVLINNTLSCYLSLISKHSDKKIRLKNIVDPIEGGGGGGRLLRPSLDPPLTSDITRIIRQFQISNAFQLINNEQCVTRINLMITYSLSSWPVISSYKRACVFLIPHVLLMFYTTFKHLVYLIYAFPITIIRRAGLYFLYALLFY